MNYSSKLLSLILFFVSFLSKGQIAIDNTASGQTMAENIMFPANIIVAGSVVLNCPNGAYGTFTNGLSDGLSIDKGIVLTTGQTTIFEQNNLKGDAGVNNGITNFIDADLQSIEPFATFDGCLIEFDINPVCNELVLDYIFGSDEYPEFVNYGYNDSFGFFVSGPGIVGTANIGTVPGSTTLVSIDNVNSNLNSTYYVDNQFVTNVEYDGYTKNLSAKITVIPCEKYHIKIVIADAGDGIYDSGVLIAVNTPPCPVNLVNWEGIDTLGKEGCVDFNFKLNRTGETTLPLLVDFKTIGTATNGSDYNFGTTSYTFLANSTSTSFNLPVLTDLLKEGIETIQIIASITNCNESYSDTLFLEIEEPSIPIDSIVSAETCVGFCDGKITITPVGAIVLNYLWDDGSTNNSIQNLCAGTYTAVISDANSCSFSQEFIIKPGGAWPDASVPNIGPICDNWANQTFNPITIGGNYTGTGVTGNPQVFSPVIAGSGTHTITYSVGTTCKSTANFTVQVLPKQDVSINPTNPVCSENDSLILSVDRGVGIWTGIGITDQNNGIFSPKISGAGVFTISYEIAGLCGDTATSSIVVVPPIDPSIIVPTLICDGDKNLTLTALNTGGIWSGTLLDPSVSTGLIKPNSPEGSYEIYHQINDVCISIDTATILIKHTPTTNFSISPGGCIPLNLTLVDISDSNAVSSVWTIENQAPILTLDSVSLILNEVNCFDIQLINTYSNGCIDTLQLNDSVCSSAQPMIDFSYLPNEVNISDQTITFQNLTIGSTNIKWTFDPPGNISESIEENPIVQFSFNSEDTVNVKLWAENLNGCVYSINKEIIIKNITSIFVPNCFTPNGDGKNDVFIPESNGYEIEEYEFWVLNRWGAVIFETTNIYQGWDGTVIGGVADRIAQNDVYVWKIKYKKVKEKTKQKLVGTVTLIR